MKENKCGYDVFILHNKDIIHYYGINNIHHGLYHHWCNSTKSLWCKGFFNEDIKYGHWLEKYEVFKYYL